jgi:hypothetical protein
MRRVSLLVLMVLILVTVSHFAMTRTSESTRPAGISIIEEPVNPWTKKDLNNRPDSFQFAIVTDRTGGHRPGIFQKAVDKINLLQPEFVVSVGDLIEGYSTDPGAWALEWSEFESHINSMQMPFFLCAGNHDISNLPMQANWKRKFGRTYYHFLLKDCLFLVLNSEDPPCDKKTPYQFSEAQQRWVSQVLAENKDVRWTFVFMHKPVWTFPDSDPKALGWTAIEDELQGRKYTVFSGHKHEYAKYIRKGMEYYMLATTGGASNLSGIANGRFDHFVWVTMKTEKPVIANLLLDGIESSDVRVLKDAAPKK